MAQPKNSKSKTSIDSNTQTRTIIIAFITGLVAGLLLMTLFIPERISTLENGEQIIVKVNEKNITSNELYNDMKNDYEITLLLNKIDDMILSEIYPETNEIKAKISKKADDTISLYQSKGYTEDQFLLEEGFKTKDEYIKYLKLDYRRNTYYEDYLKSLISEDEIKNFYNSKVFGDIKTKYIGINIDTNIELLDQILEELNSGLSYDDIIKKYKNQIKYEDLNYISFDTNIDQEYISILKNLNNNTYIKSKNDHKIIFKYDQKDKLPLDDIKDRIITMLIKEKSIDDPTLYYRILEKLRKENKVEINDTELLSKYNQYIKKITNSTN